MNQPIRVVIMKAIGFVVLMQLGATLQMWSGWEGFVAVGLSLLPALVFAWYSLPDRKTPDRFPADEAIVFYLAMLVVGYFVVDILQAPVHSSAASWLILVLWCSLILLYRVGKARLIRTKASVATLSKN